MSQDWTTKYGTRRVRKDPPTLSEAVFAAQGITDDVQGQVEIAASLMGLPEDEVRPQVLKAKPSGSQPTRLISTERGSATRTVVVERRVVRRSLGDKPLGDRRPSRGPGPGGS
jgi:hypothetical protein